MAEPSAKGRGRILLPVPSVIRAAFMHCVAVCCISGFAAGRPESLVPGGNFAGSGFGISSGAGWKLVEIADCPCAAQRGVMVSAIPGGSFGHAEIPVGIQRPAGVVTMEAMGVLSPDFLGNPALFRLSALDSAGIELSSAVETEIASLGVWHLYTLRLSVPATFASLRIRVGSGMMGGAEWETAEETGVAIDEARGNFNATEVWFGFENVQMLTIPSRGRPVAGPDGMGGRTPNLLTDGSLRMPPYGSVPWEIMAFGQSVPFQMTIDLGKLTTICGARLVQSTDKFAAAWSIYAAAENPAAGGRWTKLLEAVEQGVYDSPGGMACTAGSNCVRRVATPETSEALFSCTESQYLRLDLEERKDCCYLVIEWQLLGLPSDAICAPLCINGGRCSPSSKTCECPIQYGWEGPDCGTAKCSPPCQNGHCYTALTCRCAPGYHAGDCTEEKCGDGATSASEVCDDGNDKGDDGCVECELEDPRLGECRNFTYRWLAHPLCLYS